MWYRVSYQGSSNKVSLGVGSSAGELQGLDYGFHRDPLEGGRGP